MAESTEVTVLDGVVFDSVSAFLIAAVLGSAKGPVCMVSACSDLNDDEPCKPLGIVKINKPSFILPRDPPIESVGIKARRHCNRGFRDVFEGQGLIETSLGAEEYRAWLSKVAYTSDCLRGKNQETTGTPQSLCSIVDEQLASARNSIERMGTSTTPLPSTSGQSQDQIGEDIDGREKGSGHGEIAEEEEFSGSGSETQNPRSTTDPTLANPKLVVGVDGGSGDDNPEKEEEFSESVSESQNLLSATDPTPTTPKLVTPTENAVIHLTFEDKLGSQNLNLNNGERRKTEIFPLETKLGGVLYFLNSQNQEEDDEQTNEAGKEGSEDFNTNLISGTEMQPEGVADRETFRNVSKRDQRGAGRKPNVVQYSGDLEIRSERSTDSGSDDHLQTRIDPGAPNESGNFSTAVIQSGREWRRWILDQLKLYNGTNETDVLFPLTQEEANLFHDFLEYDVDEVEIASTVELSTILAVRRLLIRLQKVKERQGWFGIVFGISAIVTFVASIILFTKNSRLLVRYAEVRACQYRLHREAKRKEKEDKERERLRRLFPPDSPIIVSKKAGRRGWEDVEANYVKEPCGPSCQAISRCETCRHDRRYTESWTEKEVKIGFGAKVGKDRVSNTKPSEIPRKLSKPKELVKDIPTETKALLPPRDPVYPRLREAGGGGSCGYTPAGILRGR